MDPFHEDRCLVVESNTYWTPMSTSDSRIKGGIVFISSVRILLYSGKTVDPFLIKTDRS